MALDSGFDARVRGAEHAVRRVHAAAMLGNAPPDGDHCRAAAATHAAARMSSSSVVESIVNQEEQVGRRLRRLAPLKK